MTKFQYINFYLLNKLSFYIDTDTFLHFLFAKYIQCACIYQCVPHGYSAYRGQKRATDALAQEIRM